MTKRTQFPPQPSESKPLHPRQTNPARVDIAVDIAVGEAGITEKATFVGDDLGGAFAAGATPPKPGPCIPTLAPVAPPPRLREITHFGPTSPAIPLITRPEYL